MGSAFFETAAAVIPILLLVLATGESLGFVKEEWRQSGRLHAIAFLLGALIVGEVLALAAIKQESDSTAATFYLLVVVSAALGLIAWGIGWSIWDRFTEHIPGPGTWQKKAFYAIGLLTLVGIGGSAA